MSHDNEFVLNFMNVWGMPQDCQASSASEYGLAQVQEQTLSCACLNELYRVAFGLLHKRYTLRMLFNELQLVTHRCEIAQYKLNQTPERKRLSVSAFDTLLSSLKLFADYFAQRQEETLQEAMRALLLADSLLQDIGEDLELSDYTRDMVICHICGQPAQPDLPTCPRCEAIASPMSLEDCAVEGEVVVEGDREDREIAIEWLFIRLAYRHLLMGNYSLDLFSKLIIKEIARIQSVAQQVEHVLANSSVPEHCSFYAAGRELKRHLQQAQAYMEDLLAYDGSQDSCHLQESWEAIVYELAKGSRAGVDFWTTVA